jgi:hypothetical protein
VTVTYRLGEGLSRRGKSGPGCAASPLHLQRGFSRADEATLAAVPLCTAECRYIRGILVGDTDGTRTCGVFVGHLRALAGARFSADRWNSLCDHEASLRGSGTQDRPPAVRLAPIGDKAGTACIAQSNRIHLSPCRQFATERRVCICSAAQRCRLGPVQIVQL